MSFTSQFASLDSNVSISTTALFSTSLNIISVIGSILTENKEKVGKTVLRFAVPVYFMILPLLSTLIHAFSSQGKGLFKGVPLRALVHKS